MASAHLTDAELQLFRSKRLSAKQFGLASRHMQGCDACASRLRAGWEAPAAPALAAAVQHLTYEDMSAVLDRSATVDQRDWVEAHSRVCTSCSRQLTELHDLDVLLAKDEQPAAARVAEPEPRRAAAAFSAWGFWGWVNASLAAALAVGLVVLGTVSRTRQDATAAVSASPASPPLIDQPLTAGALVIGVAIVFLLLLVMSRRRNRNGKKRS